MRIVSPAEAVAGIRSGEQIYVHAAAATPSVLLDALVARAPELRDVKVVHFHIEGPGPHLAPEMAGHFYHRALFIGPNARQAVNEGRAEYIPAFLSDVPTLFRRGIIPLDAVLINVSPPDRHGYCSLGTSVVAMPTAIRTATTVIAQLNARAAHAGRQLRPRRRHRPGGRGRRPALRHALAAVGEVERRIGEHVAELVPNGATLQMGIGAIPSAVAERRCATSATWASTPR
jgi:4-hydroxybutyrate CoA-transferase